MKQNTNTATLTVAQKPSTRTATRNASPSAFRAQERFWTEVRQHIASRRPNAAGTEDRLY